jgi:hypothetical protein
VGKSWWWFFGSQPSTGRGASAANGGSILVPCAGRQLLNLTTDEQEHAGTTPELEELLHAPKASYWEYEATWEGDGNHPS